MDFAISVRLKQVSGDVLQVSDGSLYPALHKLEQEGWIKAEWRPSENNRRAKFYSLTRLGRRQLEREAENWEPPFRRHLACDQARGGLKCDSNAGSTRLDFPLRLRSLFRRSRRARTRR